MKICLNIYNDVSVETAQTLPSDHWQFLHIQWYSALLIYSGHFYSHKSRKTPHISPVKVRCGVSFMSANLIKVLSLYLLCCLHYCIIYNWIIYRKSLIVELWWDVLNSAIMWAPVLLMLLCFIMQTQVNGGYGFGQTEYGCNDNNNSDIQSHAVITHLACHDITRSNAMTAAEHKSVFELTTDTPYYGVSVVMIFKKIDHIITAPHGMLQILKWIV